MNFPEGCPLFFEQYKHSTKIISTQTASTEDVYTVLHCILRILPPVPHCYRPNYKICCVSLADLRDRAYELKIRTIGSVEEIFYQAHTEHSRVDAQHL